MFYDPTMADNTMLSKHSNSLKTGVYNRYQVLLKTHSQMDMLSPWSRTSSTSSKSAMAILRATNAKKACWNYGTHPRLMVSLRLNGFLVDHYAMECLSIGASMTKNGRTLLRKQIPSLSTKSLPKFNKGDKVLVQDNTVNSKRWKRPAVVVDRRGKHGRRYQLRFPSGRILWRNRQLLTSAPEERTS